MSAFKAGDKVIAAWRGVYRTAIIECYRPQHDDYLIKFTDNLFSADDLLSGSYSRCAGQLRHIEAAPDPYADYDGGEPQYRADVETLQAAGLLADKATAGEWEYSDGGERLEAPCYFGVWGVDNWVLEHHGYSIQIPNPADAVLILNAARVARALSRFVPWALSRLGGGS